MKFTSSFVPTSAILCGSFALLPAITLAQQTAAEGPARELEEVVVTAQKREQSLVDVPATVSAVQADALRASNISSVAGLTQLVPAMRVDYSGGFVQPTIRGVGTAVAGTGFSTNVATYVDGFYNPSQLSTDSLFINIESIDVLKGPQGTLFGRNATGGAILMRLREPSHDPAFEARIAYSTDNTLEGALYDSMGVSDDLALDFSAAFESSDGFVHNIYNGDDSAGGYDNYALRAAALWTPGRASFKLAVQYANQDDGRPYATNVIVNPANGMPSAIATLLGAYVPTTHGQANNSADTRFKSDMHGIFLTSKFDLGFANLVSYTQYRKEDDDNLLDLDGSPLHIQEGAFHNEIETFTQEFNLTGDIDRLNYVLGAFYISTSATHDPFTIVLNNAPSATFYAARAEVESWAVFADINYRLTHRLSLIAGVRYSEETPEAIWTFGQILAGFEPFFPGTGTWFDAKFDSTTPRIGLSYALTDDSNIYLTYSEGYKSGLLTPNSFTTKPLEPEDISAYEMGYKFGGTRHRLETAAFYYDYSNLQVANYIDGLAVYENAKSAEIYGAEIALTSLLTDNLQLKLGAAYVHSEYIDYVGTGFVYDPGTGTFPNVLLDLAGKQMQRSPEWTANVGLNYTKDFSGGTLDLNGNYYYTSDFPFEAANNFVQDAYGVLNLSASWSLPSSPWQFTLFATNVLDEEYNAQVLPGIPAIQRTYGRPFTAGIRISFTY
ncbi:MAG TPA: TonB-dependent receptor [Bryobacteraceae bacterium]|nr:TonB-dependent receptor [Bryobacteraceae bacterium]